MGPPGSLGLYPPIWAYGSTKTGSDQLARAGLHSPSPAQAQGHGTPLRGGGKYTRERLAGSIPPCHSPRYPPQMAPIQRFSVGLSITDFYRFLGLSWETRISNDYLLFHDYLFNMTTFDLLLHIALVIALGLGLSGTLDHATTLYRRNCRQLQRIELEESRDAKEARLTGGRANGRVAVWMATGDETAQCGLSWADWGWSAQRGAGARSRAE